MLSDHNHSGLLEILSKPHPLLWVQAAWFHHLDGWIGVVQDGSSEIQELMKPSGRGERSGPFLLWPEDGPQPPLDQLRRPGGVYVWTGSNCRWGFLTSSLLEPPSVTWEEDSP